MWDICATRTCFELVFECVTRNSYVAVPPRPVASTQVQGTPVAQRIEFLTGKGLTKLEIEEVRRRVASVRFDVWLPDKVV